MTDDLHRGPGLAMLFMLMPGSVRPPTDGAAAMIAWLAKHDAPRKAEVPRRLQHQGWTIESPNRPPPPRPSSGPRRPSPTSSRPAPRRAPTSDA
jgi:hypothetical protein